MTTRVKPWLTLAFVLLLLLLPGCGGMNQSRPDDAATPLPAFSMDQFRPNFGGDLRAANHWDKAQVTYRFPEPGTATNIHLRPMETVPLSQLSQRQKQDARDALAKWAAPLEGRVTFVEVKGDTADIDIAARHRSHFGSNTYGVCTWYRTDADRGILGRAVVTIRSDLSERRARHVLLHEIGHGLFADGHDRKAGSVMNADSPDVLGLIELSGRDRNTIRAAYHDMISAPARDL